MEFAFSEDAPIGNECRRLLMSEAAGAQARLTAFAGDPDLTIHEVRRHNKRMRGILLLTRPVLDSGDPSRASRLIRDAARRFSPARDALVRQETFDRLFELSGKARLSPSALAVRQQLGERHEAILQDEGLPIEVEGASRDFAEAARLIENWDWDQVGPEIAFSAVVSNYRLGLRHYENSRASRDPHECHEWRKRAKYLAFHYQLLTFLDPEEFATRAALAEELASWLGEHHDLAVLEDALADHGSFGLSRKSAQNLVTLCEQRRAELEKDAFARGALVYLDPPEALHERFASGLAVPA